MKSKAIWIWMIFLLVFVSHTRSGFSQEGEEKEALNYSEDPADAEACKAHLDLIYEALQEHHDRQGQWIAWLSDLVPNFLGDRHILTCPFVSRTLDLKSWRQKVMPEVFTDRYTSYGYEFCEAPVSYYFWRGIRKTQRDYKLAQMAMLGSERGPLVPLVRCFAHRPILNLAFNGEIYETGQYWEDKVAPEMHEHMEPASLFSAPQPVSGEHLKFPPRDAKAGPLQVDLSNFYNGVLTNDWQGFPGNNLINLPMGLHKLNGISYDLRGVVQLTGSNRFPWSFPEKVEGVPIQRKGSVIHFLHATGRTPQPSMITNIASYVVTYVDGQKRQHVLHYFRDIMDWWQDPTYSNRPVEVQVAWQGESEAAQSYGKAIRLYDMPWENPRPNVAISHFDFISHDPTSAPFLVAVTLE